MLTRAPASGKQFTPPIRVWYHVRRIILTEAMFKVFPALSRTPIIPEPGEYPGRIVGDGEGAAHGRSHVPHGLEILQPFQKSSIVVIIKLHAPFVYSIHKRRWRLRFVQTVIGMCRRNVQAKRVC